MSRSGVRIPEAAPPKSPRNRAFFFLNTSSVVIPGPAWSVSGQKPTRNSHYKGAGQPGDARGLGFRSSEASQPTTTKSLSEEGRRSSSHRHSVPKQRMEAIEIRDDATVIESSLTVIGSP